ncbi:MAG: hypothetical protein Q7R64_02050 [bacterium]|nr:hypothetical protein [bacterium]
MKGNRGFVKMILLIVVALIVLGFFGYNLREIVNKPMVHDNLAYVWGIVVYLWNTFIVTPFTWLLGKL